LVNFGGVITVSRLYRSAPVGGPPQNDFLNAAVLLNYPGALSELLDALQAIELSLGRVRKERWGPRTVDLDILWAADRQSATSSLTVPHADLPRRAFAVAPLVDVFPLAADPNSQNFYRDLLNQLSEQKLEIVEDENWWKRSPG
jgi:2-amino-4-hydroxy-6-hydroxymethyldihydropteridine diphosphokinase